MQYKGVERLGDSCISLASLELTKYNHKDKDKDNHSTSKQEMPERFIDSRICLKSWALNALTNLIKTKKCNVLLKYYPLH